MGFARIAPVVAILLACAAPVAAQPAQPAGPSQDAAYHNRQMLYLLTLPALEGWRATASGIRYRRVKGDGSGPRPTVADVVTIHYAGRLIDGTEFDSSIARGEPATFPLRGLIRGWQEGVPLMSVGDTFEFAIPQNLAYGPIGRGPIPGGATLVFTIELLGIVGSE
ncbi:MAG: FKBP-type peptidyl-prolyl cis-trans isomerase [Sphingobium sp.]